MRTIISGVDFTQSSYNAARYAALLATKTNSKLTLFNLFDVPMIHSNSGLYFISFSSLRNDHAGKLERFRLKLLKEFPKLVIENFVTAGSFKSELTEFIKKHPVSMVVLGLAAKNKMSKFLYGSQSTDLAGKVNAPVIIVPEKYKKHSIKKVLMGVDNSEKLHRSSLKQLADFLKETKAGLELLHVRTEEELFVDLKNREFRINNKKYPVKIVRDKNLESGLKKYTRVNKADMISVVSHKHSVFYNLFAESNTKAIAFSSNIPVMAIHE